MQALIRTYERLVMASHRMHRFHVRDKVIMDEYLKRNRNDDWDDEEGRDDEEFLRVEEELWSKMYPGQASACAAQIDVDALPDNLEEGDMLSHFFDDRDNAELMNLPMPKVPQQGEM